MKKIAIALILCLPVGTVYASSDLSGCVNFDPISGSVVVSTTPASPTKLFSKNALTKHTWLYNYSTQPIFLVGDSTTTYGTAATVSTSTVNGSFYLQNSTGSWSPDGNGDPYNGDMWAVGGTASTAPSITIYRCQ